MELLDRFSNSLTSIKEESLYPWFATLVGCKKSIFDVSHNAIFLTTLMSITISKGQMTIIKSAYTKRTSIFWSDLMNAFVTS